MNKRKEKLLAHIKQPDENFYLELESDIELEYYKELERFEQGFKAQEKDDKDIVDKFISAKEKGERQIETLPQFINKERNISDNGGIRSESDIRDNERKKNKLDQINILNIPNRDDRKKKSVTNKNELLKEVLRFEYQITDTFQFSFDPHKKKSGKRVIDRIINKDSFQEVSGAKFILNKNDSDINRPEELKELINSKKIVITDSHNLKFMNKDSDLHNVISDSEEISYSDHIINNMDNDLTEKEIKYRADEEKNINKNKQDSESDIPGSFTISMHSDDNKDSSKSSRESIFDNLPEKFLGYEKQISELKAVNFCLSEKLVNCLSENENMKKILQNKQLLDAYIKFLEASNGEMDCTLLLNLGIFK